MNGACAVALGHASPTTTLDLYGHLNPGDMDRYADSLDSSSCSGLGALSVELDVATSHLDLLVDVSPGIRPAQPWAALTSVSAKRAEGP